MWVCSFSVVMSFNMAFVPMSGPLFFSMRMAKISWTAVFFLGLMMLGALMVLSTEDQFYFSLGMDMAWLSFFGYLSAMTQHKGWIYYFLISATASLYFLLSMIGLMKSEIIPVYFSISGPWLKCAVLLLGITMGFMLGHVYTGGFFLGLLIALLAAVNMSASVWGNTWMLLVKFSSIFMLFVLGCVLFSFPLVPEHTSFLYLMSFFVGYQQSITVHTLCPIITNFLQVDIPCVVIWAGVLLGLLVMWFFLWLNAQAENSDF